VQHNLSPVVEFIDGFRVFFQVFIEIVKQKDGFHRIGFFQLTYFANEIVDGIDAWNPGYGLVVL